MVDGKAPRRASQNTENVEHHGHRTRGPGSTCPSNPKPNLHGKRPVVRNAPGGWPHPARPGVVSCTVDQSFHSWVHVSAFYYSPPLTLASRMKYIHRFHPLLCKPSIQYVNYFLKKFIICYKFKFQVLDEIILSRHLSSIYCIHM